MFCGNCGSKVEDGVLICTGCGTALETPENVESTVTDEPETLTQENTEATENNDVAKEPEENSGKKAKKEPTPEEKAKKKKIIKALIIAGVSVVVASLAFFILIIVGIVSLLNPANKVIKALDEGRYIYAVDVYEDDMDGEPNKKLIKKLDERLDNIWAEYQVNDYYYDTAADELDAIEEMNIAELDAKVEEIAKNVESLHDSREAFEDAQNEEYYEDYIEAIHYYGQVIATDPNYETAQAKIKELMPLYREELFNSIDDKYDWGYYSSAFELLYDAITTFPDDAEIKQILADSEAIIVTKADKLVSEKKYDEAIELIEEALEGYPENKTLTAKIEAIEKGRPVFLKDLTESSKSKNYRHLEATATGAEFYGCFVLDPGQDESKTAIAEYDLEKKYGKFTATFAPNGATNEKEKFTIEILVDGKVVKTIKNFTLKSKNEKVELDVTGVSKIEIRVKSTGWNDYNYINMFDACLYQ